MPHLLRLVLPDQPGMLGAVATALGRAGVDIVSLDVVERGPDGAVDDLLVELTGGALVDSLITSAHSVPGVVVESVRPYAGAGDLHRDLELVEALAADPGAAEQLLVDNAPGVFRSGWALLLDGDNVRGASRGAPELTILPGPWDSLAAARRIDPGETWVPTQWRLVATELAAAPVGSSGQVILLGRPGGPSFRASEVLRLGHLAGIAATVTPAASPASPR